MNITHQLPCLLITNANYKKRTELGGKHLNPLNAG